MTLFYYGMVLGKWNNVYLPDTADESNPWKLPRTLANLQELFLFATKVTDDGVKKLKEALPKVKVDR